MKRLLREPLLHFLLAGTLLFAAHAWINQGENEAQVVRIRTADVDWLKQAWTRQRSRPPDEQQLRGLVSGYLKEQLLAREARELGLDQDDTVVRRRLAQKMEFLVQDVVSFTEPDEAELRSLYESNRARYQSPALVSFTQVYFREAADASQALTGVDGRDAEGLGDTSLLARDYVRADEQTLTNVFGPEFSASVLTLDAGNWQGPVASAYGFHLVRVNERQGVQQRPFEDVRAQVLEDWQRAQQDRAKEQYFATLFRKYEVVVDRDVASVVGPLTGDLP